MRIETHNDPVARGERILLKIVEWPGEGNICSWSFAPNIPKRYRVPRKGDDLTVEIDTTDLNPGPYQVTAVATPEAGREGEPQFAETVFRIMHPPIDRAYVEGELLPKAEAIVSRLTQSLDRVSGVQGGGVVPPIDVRLRGRKPDDAESENNLALWQTLRERTNAMGFVPYKRFIDGVMCDTNLSLNSVPDSTSITVERLMDPTRSTIVFGVDAYNLLRAATEAFLLLETGVWVPDKGTTLVPSEMSRLGEQVTYDDLRARLNTYLRNGLPYLDRIVDALGDAGDTGYPDCLYTPDDDTRHRLIFDDGLRHPLMLELIWSYWHEEGMLVQTMNAIALRFQNRHSARDRDPLAHLEVNPLRPLNNLLWGYIQEEYRRLSLPRRAHEYSHHYGLDLIGRAVPNMRPADTRSKFLEAFHNLLTLCTSFYKQADDTTVEPDPFPLLNALREVHLLLAEGAHNQFGDLPWTARVEMLTEQWLLARPEMDRFLGGRPMVPYEEPWMGTVDTMKSLQGWTDTTITHFRDLGVYGEQLLLSVRFTDWVGINVPGPAKVWALYWRPEIQGYIHAYRAATGVDLTTDAVATQPAALRYAKPSELLRRRISERPALEGGRVTPTLAAPSGTLAPAHKTFRERRAAKR